MPSRRPVRRGFRRPMAALRAGQVCLFCFGCWTAPVLAQDGAPTTSIEACLATHGERERYLAGLMAAGWRDVFPDQRDTALAMLADAFLPVTGQIDGTWADHVAVRRSALDFWTALARNRTLMSRDGVVLLLAGFRDDNGTMRVECWAAGPPSPMTDDFFALIGAAYQSEGVSMTQVNMAARDDRPATELFVSRLEPLPPLDPPLAATDGLRTRIVFAMGEVAE